MKFRDAKKFSDRKYGYVRVDKIGRRAYDLTGMKINMLTFIQPFSQKTRPDGRIASYTWKAVCDCGNHIIIDGGSVLRKRQTKSCGCISSDRAMACLQKAIYPIIGKHAMPTRLPASEVETMGAKFINLVGKRFGSLVVKSISHFMLYHVMVRGKVIARRIPYYICHCDCGNRIVRGATTLANRVTTVKNMSCGCARYRHKKEAKPRRVRK
jgi:hypothetical protein